MNREPTFLYCVGATKAGTSWLYQHLLAHPECHFRAIKELHYFTMTTPAHFGHALKALDAKVAGMQARIAAADPGKTGWLQRQLADLAEWRKVLELGATDLPAYRDFVMRAAKEARLVGDVTPAYALLSVERLRAMLQVAADTRVLYLIRDPLARLWSHVRMIAARSGLPSAFERDAHDLLGRIVAGDLSGEGRGIVDRGDYAAIIPRLDAAFADRPLLIQFQEELLTPEGVSQLSGFLGISPTAAALEKRVHEGRPLTLDPGLRARALAWLRPQYEFVASRFPVLPEAWSKNMEKGFA